MNETRHRAVRRQMDAHFTGRSRAIDERALREHLLDCNECRARYDRWLLLAELDPSATSREDRLAQSLGIRTTRRRISLAWPLLAPAVAVGLLFFVPLALRLRGGGDSTGFTARGKGADAVGLVAYRLSPGAAPAPTQGHLTATDELSFAYRNAAALRYLLVFGVDEHRHTYWYHPAFVDPASDPRAVPIAPGAELHELPVAIRHALDGRHLRIYGLFVDESRSVKEIESEIAQRGAPADSTNATRIDLEVGP